MKYRKGVSLRELFDQGREAIRQSGMENPELEASVLLAKAFNIEAKDIYAHPEREFGPEEVGIQPFAGKKDKKGTDSLYLG